MDFRNLINKIDKLEARKILTEADEQDELKALQSKDPNAVKKAFPSFADTLAKVQAEKDAEAAGARPAQPASANPDPIPAAAGIPNPPAATAPATTPAPAANTVKTYIIKSGDTLSAIAKRYGTTVAALAQANKINNANLIYAGRKLVLPNGAKASAPAATKAAGTKSKAPAVVPKGGDAASRDATKPVSVPAPTQPNNQQSSQPNLGPVTRIKAKFPDPTPGETVWLDGTKYEYSPWTADDIRTNSDSGRWMKTTDLGPFAAAADRIKAYRKYTTPGV